MKTIIASLVCAVVAIGCLGLAPSKAEAGWYGRGVGVSIRVGPRYGYRPYGYYGGYRTVLRATAPTGITAAIGDTGITAATAPIADTGRGVLIVDGAEHCSRYGYLILLATSSPSSLAMLLAIRRASSIRQHFAVR